MTLAVLFLHKTDGSSVHEKSSPLNVNVISRVPAWLPGLLPTPLNAILKGKKKSNGSFQLALGWLRGSSGHLVTSVKATVVISGTMFIFVPRD